MLLIVRIEDNASAVIIENSPTEFNSQDDMIAFSQKVDLVVEELLEKNESIASFEYNA